MADVAHDSSSPASPKPGDVARQQVNRPDSPDKGKLRVFISYSREDLDFADQLNAALDLSGFECFIDRHGISGGEDWKRRLGNLISEADTVVFVLSPDSAISETCAWEVDEATRLNKRILSVNCRPLKGASPPPRLRDLNYIYFYAEPKAPGSGFGTGLVSLVAALNTDLDWLREHTRYLQRATEWDRGGRPANRLLSGDDIAEAKAWVARRPKGAPEPTTLHLDFIRASEEEATARLSEQRKQLEAVAAAQAEREKALHDAEEALKQAADAQRRRARIRNLAFLVVSVLAGVAVWFAWVAGNQKTQADDILNEALNVITFAQDQMNDDTKVKAFNVYKLGADHGDARSMIELGNAYINGFGVPEDYAKAREWFQKVTGKGGQFGGDAWFRLGEVYANGYGVPPDEAKARGFFEKAVAEHAVASIPAMIDLGELNENGDIPDYAKARQWYEKAGADGDAIAITHLELVPIHEAITAGQYDEALRLEGAFAAKWEGFWEAAETKRDGKPGKETARLLSELAWDALLARGFLQALAFSERGNSLFPHDFQIDRMRAHALMFSGRGDEAKALYLAHKGEINKDRRTVVWETRIADDFVEFRKAGLTHPMMADVEKELGISR
jgi:TPR repeat protein